MRFNKVPELSNKIQYEQRLNLPKKEIHNACMKESQKEINRERERERVEFPSKKGIKSLILSPFASSS